MVHNCGGVLVVVVIIIYHIIRSPRVDFNYDMEVFGGMKTVTGWEAIAQRRSVFRDQDQ